MRDDYDSPWKDVIGDFFREMMEFLFPHVAEGIDWSYGYESLDKEFQKIIRDSKVGRRHVDKLMKVRLLSGDYAILLIHVEVQVQRDKEFSERMFIYNYRIYDRYRLPVIGLAILGDDDSLWRPDRFGYGAFGAKMELQFLVSKLLDYKESLDIELGQERVEKGDNVFKFCVIAQLKALETKGDIKKRRAWKFYLLRAMLRAGYSREEIVLLIRFIDWVLILPEDIDRELWEDFYELEEVKKMPYISGFERMLLKRGKEEGLIEGMLLDAQEMVIEALEEQFGSVHDAIVKAIKGINKREVLKTRRRRARGGEGLDEFMEYLKTSQCVNV